MGRKKGRKRGKERRRKDGEKKGRREEKRGPFIFYDETQKPNISCQRKWICHLEIIKNVRVSV